MTKEHHYVIVYREGTGWDIDIDTEESAFPDGTIYNTETKDWEYGYLGEGEYNKDEQAITEQLSKALRQMNGED
jgi:hypothetical protein